MLNRHSNMVSRHEIVMLVSKDNGPSSAGHCETSRRFIESSNPYPLCSCAASSCPWWPSSSSGSRSSTGLSPGSRATTAPRPSSSPRRGCSRPWEPRASTCWSSSPSTRWPRPPEDAIECDVMWYVCSCTSTWRCGWSSSSSPGPRPTLSRATPSRCSASSSSTSTSPSSTSLWSRLIAIWSVFVRNFVLLY